ncbi:hypothetical protein BX600DRAFT_512221 [Xylariales sp. PMI_506]|nr:hypothetical protein BX600DRAFT_512221 [Xylariales sp. PMI_506]
MASESPDPVAGATTPLAFTLQIISPSLGVPAGLKFTTLLASSTVRELKEKIRDALDSKPTSQAQRLIHRGRLLARDDETMLEVFGEEALRSTDRQTLHLVLRDLSDARPASTTTTNPTTNGSPAPAPGQTQPSLGPQIPPQHNQHHHIHAQQHAQQHARVGGPVPNLPFGLAQHGTLGGGAAGGLPFGYNPQHMAQHHQRIHEMLANQNLRERTAQDGQAGIQRGTPAQNATPGRAASPLQPDGTRTVVREGFGPNGQQWRITVNETVTTPQAFQRNPRTGSPFSAADLQNMWRPPTATSQPRYATFGTPHGGQLSGAEVQNILRTADAGQAATRIMSNAMRRNTSNSSLVNLSNSQATQPIPPGVSTPLVASRSNSAMGHRPTSTSGSPEVYILSSPEGPRALLLNGNLGAYVTPPNLQIQLPGYAMRPQFPFMPPLPFGSPSGINLSGGSPHPGQTQRQQSPLGGSWAPPPAEHVTTHNQQQQQQQPQGEPVLPQGLPQVPHAQPQFAHGAVHPGNLHVRAVALAQIWPHVWMVMRLILFIWWFTTPTASWYRWFTVISIALVVFLINTGLLNPVAEQVWTPIRRHLENLMPLADNHGRHRPAGAENAIAGQRDGADEADRRDLDPADTAARLLQERRNANANWLMGQVRRLERAGILFLASIAPGVAERHIAHIEAEARAERQRREAQAEAEAARSSANAADSGSNNAENADLRDGDREQPDENPGGERPQGNEEPLVAI